MTKQDPNQLLIAQVIQIGLDAMQQAANTLKVLGTAMVAVQLDISFDTTLLESRHCGMEIRQPLHSRGMADPGSNYWGLAAEMIAYMRRTNSDSGAPPNTRVMEGETVYVGGALLKLGNGNVYFAFAGATPNLCKLVAFEGFKAVGNFVESFVLE